MDGQQEGFRSAEEALAGVVHNLEFNLGAEISDSKKLELQALGVGQSATVELPGGEMATITRVDEMGYTTETSAAADGAEDMPDAGVSAAE